jgi:hypothetical protein
MSTERLCDRCGVGVADNSGSVLTITDRATRGIEDFDGTTPTPFDVDLCSLCRSDLGQFLGVEE